MVGLAVVRRLAERHRSPPGDDVSLDGAERATLKMYQVALLEVRVGVGAGLAGSIPQSSAYSGTFEPKGVDYDPATGLLRVEITQLGVCEVATIHAYKQS